ncbi:MAG: hypothetical protein ACYSYT_11380 [Planctomycetota bacterium]|jgi:hypothetical protein
MKRYFVFAFAVALTTATVWGAENLLCNAGFEEEVGSLCVPAQPTDYCYWSGNHAEIVPASDGITPFEGSKMVHLEHTTTGCGGAGSTTGCDQWQIIDISAFGAKISAGNVVAWASARFNRVMGDANTDTEFLIELLAYAGDPSTFPSQFNSSELAIANHTVYTDGDPATWELARACLVLPTNTDFLVVRIASVENVYNNYSGTEFDGHYADAVSATISGLHLRVDLGLPQCYDRGNTIIRDPPRSRGL